MRKILIICLALIVSISLAIDLTSDNCLSSIAIGDVRPRVTAIRLSQGFEVQELHISMARHHIVPYNLLRQFFNTIVEHGTRTLQDRLYNFIASLGTRVLNIDIPELHVTVYERRMEILRNLDGMPIDFDIDAYRALDRNVRIMHQLFAWMPFNIFEGPAGQYRSDDPGPLFEIHCREIIGQQLFSNLQLVNAAILEYRSSPHIPAFGEQTLHLLEESFNLRSDPFTFNHENWFVRFQKNGATTGRRRRPQPKAAPQPKQPDILVRFELRTPENRRQQMETENVYFDVSLDNNYECSVINPDTPAPKQRSIRNIMVLSEPNRRHNGPCFVKLIFPSTVRDDPVCLISLDRTLQGIKNKTLLVEYGTNHTKNKIWDLRDLQLMATNELVRAVDTFKLSEYASWKEWFQQDRFHHSGNLLFKDKSFVIEYFLPCINSKRFDCLGATIFDSAKRPIGKLRRENKTVFMYLQGKWQQTTKADWYSWVNSTDVNVPRFNVTIRLAQNPSRVAKPFAHEECSVPIMSAGMLGGALSGAVVGSAVPIFGTAVGGFFGLVGGVAVGLITGTIFADSICK